MRTVPELLCFVSVLGRPFQDAVRFILLGSRSNAAVKAENLFLRKQLALYLERKVKSRTTHDATRITLRLSNPLKGE